LHQKHRDHFAQDDPDVLVVQGASQTFNPSLAAATIEAQRAADPTAAAGEWDAQFRFDLTSYLDDRLLEAAIEFGRPLELPPLFGFAMPPYAAFVDPSGGVGSDSYTLAIGHREDDVHVIDAIRGTEGVYNPSEVTKQYADLCRQYHLTTVTGDFYAAQWVSSAWAECGISYVKSELNKSQIYLEVLPLFARGLVRLPDHPKLLRELRLLERSTHRSGKDTVNHPRNGRDDHANAVCGVLRCLSNPNGFDHSFAWVDGGNDQQGADAWRAARLRSYLRQWVPV
jgi:hypothetical protein